MRREKGKRPRQTDWQSLETGTGTGTGNLFAKKRKRTNTKKEVVRWDGQDGNLERREDTQISQADYWRVASS